MIVLTILIGTAISYFLAKGITVPLVALTEIFTRMSTGDLNRNITETQRDRIRNTYGEIGDLGWSATRFRGYILGIAEISQKIAEGDLTATYTPKSEKDELGFAFAKMLETLKEIISEIVEQSNSVNTASQQLAAASNQAGQATGQIATTIQQVAKGTSQQTNAITQTVSTIEQMGRSIDGVSKGAQEQSNAVQQMANNVSELVEGMAQLANASQIDKQNNQLSAEKAQIGTLTVNETIQGAEFDYFFTNSAPKSLSTKDTSWALHLRQNLNQ
jgi:methyl-accepting chemotaxis protein